MQGAGNDFVVLNGIEQRLDLTAQRVRALADRRFGVGADQILVVERPSDPVADFRYRIFNADGGEVEQCGNGARCFVRYVRDKGLTGKDRLRVRTLSGVIEPPAMTDRALPARRTLLAMFIAPSSAVAAPPDVSTRSTPRSMSVSSASAFPA